MANIPLHQKIFKCLRCKNFQALSIRLLLQHYRCVHANEPSFSVRCNVDGCPATFTLYNSLYKHITRKHKEIYNKAYVEEPHTDDGDFENENEDNDQDVSGGDDDDIDDDDYYNDDDIEHSSSDSDFDACNNMMSNSRENDTHNPRMRLRKSAAQFILKTKERNMLTQATMDKITDNVSCLIGQYSDIIKQQIVQRLEANQEINQETLSDILNESNNVFDGISTEAQHKAFVKANLPHVEAQKVELGSVLSRKRKSNGCIITESEESFMYVPFLDSIKQMLGNPELAKLLLTRKQKNFQNEYYYDFFDGSVYKNDEYFSMHPDALVIILYHDDLEVCNALGSSAGVHKVDMYYNCIANIPPKYRSRHCAVNLLAIVNTSFVKKYGVEKVLLPIINDLRTLYHGYEIELENGNNFTLYGKVLVCLGDTLGQHLWGGFKEGVGLSYQKCRECFCNFEALQKNFRLQEFTVRTKALHHKHCTEIENATTEGMKNDLRTSYGITKRSALCQLPNFDVTKQLPQDVMHIAFEGVVQYELRLVLEILFNAKVTTLQAVNGSILSHNFGYSEVASKPLPIKDTVFTGDEMYKLKQKAAQARLFLRIFPFLLEPLIGTDNEYFLFVLDLIEIIQILCSPAIQEKTIHELNDMVQKHFQDFKLLFQDKNLLPKHHYLLHLINSIREFGPPMRYSCFSYEAAHKYFKSIARSQNFKNLPYSLAKRYQYLETSNYGDHNEDCLSHPLFEKEKMYGVVKELKNDEKHSLRIKFDELSLLPGIELTIAFKVSWVVRYGTKYNCNAIIAVDADPVTLLPIFGKVVNILIVHDFVYFEVNIFKSKCYSKLFHAYNVELENVLCHYPYTSLLDYSVLHLKSDSLNNTYIQPKHSLCDIAELHIEGKNPLHA